tara:strand:+ start:7460 stop:9412 length:1953 start_codon:yes stop_codon:yes gene_type:complete
MSTSSAKLGMIVEGLYKHNYVDVIDGLRPDSTFNVNPSLSSFIEIYLEDSKQFLELMREAVFRILTEKRGKSKYELIESNFSNLKIKLVVKDVINLHEISAKNENCTITFDCQIIATDFPKSYIKEALFICPICSRDQHMTSDINRKIGQPYCPNTSCKKAKMEVEQRSIITDDVQTILMQELMENSENHSPIIMAGKLIGNNVRTSFVGQRKRITGLFRSEIDIKKNENDIFIDILSLIDLEEYRPTMPSDESLSIIQKDLKKEGFIDKLVGSFAPNIFGYEDIKLSILLELVGGVRTKKRGDINIFLVGDPSMAKSELLKFAQKITQRSIYTSGRGASAAGLTIGMVKMPDGRMIAQAGVLPICNNGFAFIDEFDKMNRDDRSSMHEAMEQQTVSIAKSGIQMTLPTKTSILAAANPKYGVYDSTITLRDNIDIPAPLLSRFDLIWLIKDKIHVTEDMLKANHILDTFTSDKREVYLNEKELTAFLNYARGFKPMLQEESKSKLLEIYERMRNASAKSDMPVGTRQLEALVRLSMAYAKLFLRDKVTIYDVEKVEALVNSMYESFGLSLAKGSIQQQIYFDKKNTKQHDALTIWNGCRDEKNHVKLSKFEESLKEAGMSEIESKRLIDQWENNNIIKLNDDGTYTRIG